MALVGSLSGRSSDLHRIVVLGTSGSGKTYLARELSELLLLNRIELDALFWLEDWRERPEVEFRQRVVKATAGDRWIVDGNYSRVRELYWPRATAIIWLNYSFPLTFWRALIRTFRRSLWRERLWAGNRETLLKAFFSRDSILWWVISTHSRRRSEFGALRDSGAFDGLVYLEFRHPREVTKFIRSLTEPRL